MKSVLKNVWHEFNAFVSTFKMAVSGDKTTRETSMKYLLKYKFVNHEKYLKKLAGLKPKTDELGKFIKIRIENQVFYWPSEANMTSLNAVLAEAIFTDHPHYYDSQSTTLEQGDKVLDIGACEGTFALHAAKTASRVVAVEPSNTMIEAINLAARDRNFSNIECVSGLIGHSNCELGFFENTAAPEASMIVDRELASDYRQCWTLDKFVELYFPSGIDYIKCDAEGADFDILASGKEILAKYRPKIAVAVYHSEDDYSNIKNLLSDLNYIVQAQGIHYSPVRHKCWPVLLKAVSNNGGKAT